MTEYGVRATSTIGDEGPALRRPRRSAPLPPPDRRTLLRLARELGVKLPGE
ncbi:MAG TPA: hypothetical protein VN864_08430 [Thermoplasmata archaeon]|nr:hypothetical protein [Thermoplasmata archaeon]